MKRITLIICSLLVILGATTSCQEHVTEVTEVYTTPARTIIFDLNSSKWTPYDNSTAFYTALNVPELTSSFNDIGGVLVYISRAVGVYEALPMTYDNFAYSFSTTPGAIRIDVQTIPVKTMSRPEFMQVKVVLIDAEDISMLKEKGIDLKDIKAVQKALGTTEKYVPVN
ncbi:hypothetical protein C3K47_18660 [Solitalea longa]|uniref:DUF4840 domain-containing protein n=1 Tax=Solitalea longa TaxID=2079460 RepID=A0A2S4ZWU0_9SPHI|nr:hypothetical protein [Solitalea longa]POY34756.1 hypothetical protein C3K47_18660 [Solitalea longa]